MKDKDNILGSAEEQSKELDDILGQKDAADNSQDINEEEKDNKENSEGDEEIEIIDNPDVLGHKEKKKKVLDHHEKAIAALGIAAVALIALIVILIIGAKKKSVADSGKIDIANGFELSADADSMTNSIKSAVSTLYNNNAYLTLHVGEKDDDVVYMMYNKDKECYIESGYDSSLAVMRNDYKAVNLTNPVEVSEDIDILQFIGRAVELVRTGHADISSEDITTESDTEATKYYITINGKHNIKKIYTVVSEEYANDMMDNIFGDKYDASKYSNPKYVDKDDEDSIEIQVVIGKNNGIAAQCNIMIEGFNYINWWFDGYMELESYKLDDKWYSEDNDIDTWIKLATDLQTTISDNITEYLDNNVTDEEMQAVEDDTDSEDTPETKEELKIVEYERPEGELTAEEKEYWDKMDVITQKIQNGEDITDDEKLLYYALPASNPGEAD